MLRVAFEDLAFRRVQFTASETSDRSRSVILRPGARPQGSVRRERIVPDERGRNSARFSITDDEWPAIRLRSWAARQPVSTPRRAGRLMPRDRLQAHRRRRDDPVAT